MGGSRKHRTGLVHAKPKQLDQARSDINVTPLIDVCLVLLIVFMIVTPMMSRGQHVELPKTKHHAENKDLGEQPIVSIKKEGGKVVYYFDKDLVAATAEETAEQKLRRVSEEALVRAAKGHTDIDAIFVKADEALTWGDVYPALMAIHESGSSGVALGTNEDKKGAAAP